MADGGNLREACAGDGGGDFTQHGWREQAVGRPADEQGRDGPAGEARRLDAELVPAADRMRTAARAKVDAHGLVQGVAGAPDFRHAGIAPEGQAFFLLMETAARKAGRPAP